MPFSAKSLGAGLRAVREEAKLQARQLAELAGVAPSQISEVETGKRSASIGFLERIAPALGMNPWTLQRRIEDIARVLEEGADPLRDEPPPYKIAGLNISPAATQSAGITTDYEALARHLLKDLPRERMIEMIHEFTNQAAAGDRLASQRARALLEIIATP